MTSKITIPGGAAAVEKMMFALKNEAEAANLCRFFKTGRGQYGEGDLFLGIKVPVTRQVVKETWRECMIEDVDQLLASPWHEIRLCALLILVRLFANAKTNFNLRKRIVEYYLSRSARYKTMPRTMLRYAIEKFPEAKREAFLKGRI